MNNYQINQRKYLKKQEKQEKIIKSLNDKLFGNINKEKFFYLKSERRIGKTGILFETINFIKKNEKEINKKIINFLLINKKLNIIPNDLARYISSFIYEKPLIIFR